MKNLETKFSLIKKLKEECGIFGIFENERAGELTFYGLYALQHRGQEGAGIAITDGKNIIFKKGYGYVSDIFNEETLKVLKGTRAIGHVRYSTHGESSPRNIQPFVIEGFRGSIAIAHNGNLVNAIQLRKKLEEEGAIFQSTSDTEIILHLIARSKAGNIEEALVDALSKVKGAYSLLFLTPKAIYSARDPHGFRPLAIGKLENSWVIASETSAFDLIEAEYIRDVQPGEILRINGDGIKTIYNFSKIKPAHCIFEYIYFSRPDSLVFGKNVNEVRKRLGKKLAKEQPSDADIVVPIPDSGMWAGLGYSEGSGIPLEFALIRNHYIGRTFIQPHQKERIFGVRIKLNPVKELINGKRVVLVDDSIVRGTTSRRIVRMVRDAGAKEIHYRVSSPPIIGPCYYGIDTPTKEELIASTHSLEEIRRFLDVETLGYLSKNGMLEAVSNEDVYCTACFDLNYLVEIPQDDFIQLRLFERGEE
ncbi:MAG: amidophosphoribosyltransferase [Candidatus Aminicenantia bacterium]